MYCWMWKGGSVAATSASAISIGSALPASSEASTAKAATRPPVYSTWSSAAFTGALEGSPESVRKPP